MDFSLELPVGSAPIVRARRVGVWVRRGFALLLLVCGACIDDSPMTTGPSSHLRFIQAVPNAPVVDLLFDSSTVGANLGYRAETGFLRVRAGDRRVQIRQVWTTTMLMDLTVPVEFPRAYTVISTGLLNDVQPVVAPDTASIPDVGEFKLRILHAAPSAGLVDVYVTDVSASLAGATPMVTGLSFRGNTEYYVFPVGNQRVRITAAGTTNTLIDVTNLFGERVMRSVVMTDAVGGGAPFAGMLLVDF
ncbi:MAG: DUF4397 domain-containing protein [Gemmatimonadaceae bacterium]|nr:DUF4397 domain-containing protein [Gemmatimonadaceae bacterium]